MKYLYEENYESFIKRMKDDHDIEFIAEVSSNDVTITMLHNGIKVDKQTYPMTYLFNHVEKQKHLNNGVIFLKWITKISKVLTTGGYTLLNG